jgi:hypothetical protein
MVNSHGKGKKIKTPRTGVPPKGYVRVVMDYPKYQADGRETLAVWDRGVGSRIVRDGDTDTAAVGEMVRMIKNAEDCGFGDVPW